MLMRIDPSMSISGVFSLLLLRDDCGVKGSHKVIACHQENLQGRLKNAKTSEKVFSEKKFHEENLALG